MGLSHFVKKSFIFVSILFMALFLSACDDKQDVLENIEKMKISACPTFQSFFEENEKIDLIRSNSTSQSLSLLKNWTVDYAIGWRTPKPNENFEYKNLWSGYSFLSKNSQTISDQDLQKIKFYTDLQQVSDIKKIFWIQSLEKVENIYDYIQENIIISSWENTDYSKANIVHVLRPNWERYIESRIPILYCKEKCDKNIIKTIKEFLNK